jgi:hypothetical protein
MTYQTIISVSSTIRFDERSAPGSSLGLPTDNCSRDTLGPVFLCHCPALDGQVEVKTASGGFYLDLPKAGNAITITQIWPAAQWTD